MAPLVLLALAVSDGSDPLETVESVVNLFTVVPTLVVSIIMMTKTKKLLLPVLACNTEAFKYCNSVSGIVLGALFNEPALVFHIINFVRMKSSKRELDGILNPEHQSATIPSSQGLSAATPAAQAVPNDDDDI
jgi:ABC-type sulfate transport system permease component